MDRETSVGDIDAYRAGRGEIPSDQAIRAAVLEALVQRFPDRTVAAGAGRWALGLLWGRDRAGAPRQRDGDVANARVFLGKALVRVRPGAPRIVTAFEVNPERWELAVVVGDNRTPALVGPRHAFLVGNADASADFARECVRLLNGAADAHLGRAAELSELWGVHSDRAVVIPGLTPTPGRPAAATVEATWNGSVTAAFEHLARAYGERSRMEREIIDETSRTVAALRNEIGSAGLGELSPSLVDAVVRVPSRSGLAGLVAHRSVPMLTVCSGGPHREFQPPRRPQDGIAPVYEEAVIHHSLERPPTDRTPGRRTSLATAPSLDACVWFLRELPRMLVQRALRPPGTAAPMPSPTRPHLRLIRGDEPPTLG